MELINRVEKIMRKYDSHRAELIEVVTCFLLQNSTTFLTLEEMVNCEALANSIKFPEHRKDEEK